jgi:hypothetical protein
MLMPVGGYMYHIVHCRWVIKSFVNGGTITGKLSAVISVIIYEPGVVFLVRIPRQDTTGTRETILLVPAGIELYHWQRWKFSTDTTHAHTFFVSSSVPSSSASLARRARRKKKENLDEISIKIPHYQMFHLASSLFNSVNDFHARARDV